MKYNIFNFFVSIFILIGLCRASEKPKHYEVIGGKPVYHQSEINCGQETYARLYEKPEDEKILNDINLLKDQLRYDGNQCKSYGEKYSYDDRPPLKKRYSFSGGGFFLTVKKLEGDNIYLMSGEYALTAFKEQIENIGLSMERVLGEYKNYGTSYIVNKYFECTKEPKEGDLVVYQNGDGDGYIHSGIYRKIKPSSDIGWNSTDFGTVESKWGTINRNPYVFQHDIFFIPNSYGNLAVFYRLKENKDSQIIDFEQVHFSHPMYKIQENGYFIFNRVEITANIRREIDLFRNQKPILGIEELKEIEFDGVCSEYALSKIIHNYKNSELSSIVGNPDNLLIEKYFKITEEPKEGDLVCYYGNVNLNKPVHFGVYLTGDIIESKWGYGSVFKHQPFHISNSYGDYLRYYRYNQH